MTFKLGLTGSIGMGKSTTAKLFAEEGCSIWDADAAVHRLYSEGGEAVEPIGNIFPQVIEGGSVSRPQLKSLIEADPDVLQQIEKIVHPLLGEDRQRFLMSPRSDIIVLDIPLLFETGSDTLVDAVVCVTVSPAIQRKRVLERGTMNEVQFKAILSKQMADSEKRRRSDYLIHTDTLEHARKQVQAVTNDIRSRLSHA